MVWKDSLCSHRAQVYTEGNVPERDSGWESEALVVALNHDGPPHIAYGSPNQTPF